MGLKSELIPVPIADIDGTKKIDIDQAGFVLNHGVWPSAIVWVMQLTPPNSLRGLHLVVSNIDLTRG